MAEEGIKIEGEGNSGAMNPQVVENAQVEKARTKGWRPLDEFKGDPADWVDHKEFLGREKLFDKIHDLKNQLSRQAQKFEKDMTVIQSNYAKMQEVEYARAKKDLEEQLKAAKAAGEVEAVADISEELAEVKAQEKEAKQAAKEAAQAQRQQGPTQEFIDWQKQNQWFGPEGDAEMTADAIVVGNGYARANPSKSQAEVLAYVTSRMKKMYSEKFEGQPQEKKVSKVEGGGNHRPQEKKKGQLTVGDLDDTQRSVMNTLIKRGALKEIAAKNKRTQQEEYLAQLSERLSA